MSVLLVEHDMDFVMNLTDRLVVMEFGTRIAEGSAAGSAAGPGRARGVPWRGGVTENDMNAAAPILDVNGLSVRYGKVEALHGAAIKRAGPARSCR